MIRQVCSWCAVVVFGLVLSAQTPSPPNLSGRWVFNLARSSLPSFRTDNQEGSAMRVDKCCLPKSVIEVIQHKGPNLTITTDSVEVDDQGKEYPSSEVWRLNTRVRETINTRGSSRFFCRSVWKQNKLVTSVVNEGGYHLVVVRSLSPDSRTLTEEMYLGEGKGKPFMTYVMERSNQ